MAAVITYNSDDRWTIMTSKTKESKRQEKCQNDSLTQIFFAYCTTMHRSQKERESVRTVHYAKIFLDIVAYGKIIPDDIK